MMTARLFKDGTIVDAYDVYNGIISRYNDFVDVEEDFRVVYCGGAKRKKNGESGRPHFKLYLSREDYKKLTDEQKTRLEILRTQRHFQESEWHRNWESCLEEFADIEKTITNLVTGKRKRADAFIQSSNLCIEFQHSYINYDFEERNSFYGDMGLDTIWIYDLTSQDVKNKDGSYSILENNARGFFRIAENPDNLKINTVFIQAKDRKLYLIKELLRKEIDSDKKSTIRVFEPVCIFDPDEFVAKIKNADLSFMKKQTEDDLPIFPADFYILNPNKIDSMTPKTTDSSAVELKSVAELWYWKYYFMILYDPEKQIYIRIEKSKRNNRGMERVGKWKYVSCQEVYWDSNSREYTPKYDYKKEMSWEEEESKSWQLIWGFYDWYK